MAEIVFDLCGTHDVTALLIGWKLTFYCKLNYSNPVIYLDLVRIRMALDWYCTLDLAGDPSRDTKKVAYLLLRPRISFFFAVRKAMRQVSW